MNLKLSIEEVALFCYGRSANTSYTAEIKKNFENKPHS